MTTPNQSPAPRSASLADGGDASPWARTPARGPEPILEVGVEKTSGGTGGATSGGSAEVVSTPERKKQTTDLGEGPPRNNEPENQKLCGEEKRGAGATAEIEADTIGRELLQQRISEATEKLTVTRVGWIVFVKIILCLFLLVREMKFGGNKDEGAFFAPFILAAFVLKKKRGVAMAERAGHAERL